MAANPSVSRPAPPADRLWQPTPVMDWPAEWRQFLQLTPKALFAWTYLGLGKDIIDSKNPALRRDLQRQARSQLLGSMLSDLAHPAGTHTFWPMSLDGTVSETGIDMFWSGASALGCRGVLILGSPAAWALVPRKDLRPLMQFRHHGQLVWIIDDPNRLCEQPLAYARVLEFLRSGMQLVLRGHGA